MRTQKAPTTTDPYYNDGETLSPWRESLNTVIFGSETPMGKAFDVVLSISIVLSVIVIMLDSVEAIQNRYAQALYIIEWLFTLLFTLEYGLRLISVRRPWLYFKSFFGLGRFDLDTAQLPDSAVSRHPGHARDTHFTAAAGFSYP